MVLLVPTTSGTCSQAWDIGLECSLEWNILELLIGRGDPSLAWVEK